MLRERFELWNVRDSSEVQNHRRLETYTARAYKRVITRAVHIERWGRAASPVRTPYNPMCLCVHNHRPSWSAIRTYKRELPPHYQVIEKFITKSLRCLLLFSFAPITGHYTDVEFFCSSFICPLVTHALEDTWTSPKLAVNNKFFFLLMGWRI